MKATAVYQPSNIKMYPPAPGEDDTPLLCSTCEVRKANPQRTWPALIEPPTQDSSDYMAFNPCFPLDIAIKLFTTKYEQQPKYRFIRGNLLNLGPTPDRGIRCQTMTTDPSPKLN